MKMGDEPSPIDAMWDATDSINDRLGDIIALLRQLVQAVDVLGVRLDAKDQEQSPRDVVGMGG